MSNEIEDFVILIPANDSRDENIHAAFNLFNQGDHVKIFILADFDPQDVNDEIAKKSQVTDLITQASRSFGSQPRYKVLNAAHTDDTQDAHIVLDGLWNEEDLYRQYTDFVGNENLEIYENRSVVDLYDPHAIYDKRQEDSGYVGSTDLNQFGFYLGWIEFKLREGQPKLKILDMGCGAGAFYFLLKQYLSPENFKKLDYMGIDKSRANVFRARERYPEANFYYGDAAHMNMGDSTFDCVFLHSILVFNETPDQLKILRRMAEISNSNVFGAMATRSNEHFFPIAEKRISEGISSHGNTVQMEFYPAEVDVQNIIINAQIKRVTLHRQIYFEQGGTTVSILNDTHDYYNQVLQFMKTQPPSNEGLQATFLDKGAGLFFQVNRLTVYANDFDFQPLEKDVPDLNVMFDEIATL